MPAAVVALFLLGELAFRLAVFGPAALWRPWDYSAAGFFDRGVAEPDPDPRILWRLVPGRRTMLKGAPFTTNALGLRGPEITPEKRPGELRIAALGASITAGEGVADGEPWPRRLEAHLHDLGRSDVTVLNGAVQNYEASQLVAAYEVRLRPLGPDAVVVPIYPGLLANVDTPAVGVFERRTAGDLSARRLLAPFFLTKALRGAFQRAGSRVLADDWAARARPPATPTEAPSFATLLSRFAAELARDDVTLYFALVPKPAERPPTRRFAAQRAGAAAIAAAHPNVVVLDLLDALAPQVGVGDRIYPGDRHPNRRYHELLGRTIAGALAPRLPPARPDPPPAR